MKRLHVNAIHLKFNKYLCDIDVLYIWCTIFLSLFTRNTVYSIPLKETCGCYSLKISFSFLLSFFLSHGLLTVLFFVDIVHVFTFLLLLVYRVKIYAINVTNTLDGGAAMCKDCPVSSDGKTGYVFLHNNTCTVCVTSFCMSKKLDLFCMYNVF